MKTNQKKYWFISEFYWPVENATGYIITHIIDYFSLKKSVHVLTVGNFVSEERNKNIHTVRISSNSSLNKNKLFQRLLKLLIISVKFAWKICQNIRAGDVVITVTNPAFILVFLSLIKKMKKMKLIVIVHDVFPENLLVAGITRENSFLYKMAKSLFNYSYRQADLLITCGRDMNKVIQKKLKYPDLTCSIPNFADTRTIVPIPKEKNPILIKFGIVNKFVVFFTGNIGRLQGIDNLLETIRILKGEKDICWLFIGEGACLDGMKSFVERNEILNVQFHPNMKRQYAIDFLNAGDIGIVSLLPNMRGTGVPSKTYTYMAAGKSILAIMDEDTEVAQMIKEHQIGWLVNPQEPRKLAELIVYLKNNPQLVRETGKKARTVCEQFYSLDTITEQYINKILS